jgi:transmembrane sensor
MSVRSDIEDIAATWLMRQADGLTAEESAQRDAWLNASTEHRMAFWRLEYSWEKVGRLGALRAPDTLDATLAEAHATPASHVSSPPQARALPRWAIGLAAALVVAALAASVAMWPRPALYSTKTGEHQLVSLTDGSRVELNTATRMRAAISSEDREAWLDKGEAYFEVAHDPSRPFIVHMGDKTVTVLGTRFSVRRDGDEVRVVVAEGRVRLSGAKNDLGVQPTILTRGDVALGQGESILHSRATPQRVQDQLAWRRGLVVFDQITLADAAAEFNRYNQTQISVVDPQTANMRIGGSFEAANVDAFVRLLQNAYGLEIRRDGETIEISE